jgi:hypothetical protein
MVPGEDPLAYVPIKGGDRLHQGEVVSNIVERLVRFMQRTAGGDEFGFDEVMHPFAVILTQDCDLEQDAKARGTDEMDEAKRRNALLSSVLLVVASTFDNATGLGGSDIKRRAKQNKDERYQFLSAVPSGLDAGGQGIPGLLLDFKRFFTYPTEQLLSAICRGETIRRTRLATPYAEHLSGRFAYFVQRIGLPRDHHDF